MTERSAFERDDRPDIIDGLAEGNCGGPLVVVRVPGAARLVPPRVVGQHDVPRMPAAKIRELRCHGQLLTSVSRNPQPAVRGLGLGCYRR